MLPSPPSIQTYLYPAFPTLKPWLTQKATVQYVASKVYHLLRSGVQLPVHNTHKGTRYFELLEVYEGEGFYKRCCLIEDDQIETQVRVLCAQGHQQLEVFAERSLFPDHTFGELTICWELRELQPASQHPSPPPSPPEYIRSRA